MKTLKLKLGDILVICKDVQVKPGSAKGKREYLGEYDVIKVNKKSYVLQNYPTYERLILKK